MPAQITALPTPPSTNDPANFNTRADAFLGQMPTFVTEANAVATEVVANAAQVAADRVQTGVDRAAAAVSAASALNAPGTNGTSTTSVTIGTGTKVFVTQAGKAWSKGQGVVVASTSNPLNQLRGIITDYAGVNLTVEVSGVDGSGTFAAWTISMSAGAPMLIASQVQAEAGDDNSTVLTPLRGKQLVDKLAIQVADSVMTSAVTLGANAKYGQIANMPRRGIGVTLPNATAMTPGPRFSITNDGQYDLPVKDSAGAIRAFVRPGQTATCILIAAGSAAGTWRFKGHALFGETGYYQGSNGPAIYGVTSIALDATRDLTVWSAGSAGVKAVVYDKSTGLYGAVTSVHGVYAGNVARALLIGTDKVLIVSCYSNTFNLVGVVISISGMIISAGSAFNYTAASGSIFIHAISAIGSSYVVTFSDLVAGVGVTKVIACTVSGTTITWGSAITIFAGVGSVASDNAKFGLLLVAGTLVIVQMFPGDSAIYWNAVTVSGSIVTAGTSSGVANSGTGASFRIELLGTGRILLVYSSGNIVNGRLLSVSGTTVNASSNISSASTWGGSQSDLSVYAVGSNKLVYLCSSSSTASMGVFTDSSGALSVSSAVSIGMPGTPDSTARVLLSGSNAYFVKGGTSFEMLFKIDCAGPTPVLVETQLYQFTPGGAGGISAVNGSDSGPLDSSERSGRKLRSASAGLITSAGSVSVVRNPNLRIIANDSTSPNFLYAGTTPADVVNIQPEFTLRLEAVA